MATVREVLTAEYGEDFARSISHIAEVHNTYRTDGEDTLVFNLARSGDVHGYDNALEVSNYRDLISRWEDFDIKTRTWINVDTIGLRLDSPAPADLTEVIDALENYPVLDESLMSEVECEIIDEHWQSYGRHDILGAVADALGVDRSDLTDYAEDLVSRLVWSGVIDYGDGGGYPTMIDDSAVDFGDKEISAWIAENIGNRVELSRYPGDKPETFDLTAEVMFVPVSA